MAAVPIYVWNGTAWQETGPVIPASPIAYQASAPSSPSTGDIWVDSDGDVTTGSQQFQRFRFVASGGETSISGVDANGATLAYTAGTEIVALNGSTLVRGQDYTATNGTSITGLSPALVANDVVEVFSFMAFNVANTYTQSQVDGLLENYMGMRLIVPSSVSSGATISSTGAVTFTGVSSVSLNGVFSSSYDNYAIKFTVDPLVTTAQNIQLRLRTTTDESSSNYHQSGFYNASTGATLVGEANAGVTGFSTVYATTAAGDYAMANIELFSPNLTKPTLFQNLAVRRDSSSSSQLYRLGALNTTTQYTGFSLIVTTSMTGTVRVYGYKN